MTRNHWTAVLLGLVLTGCGGGGVEAPFDAPELDQAPSIAPIADADLPGNTTLLKEVTVADADDAPEALSVEASSSDAGVIRPEDIHVTGDGEQRTVSITPVLDALGRSDIALRVTDPAGASATRTFTVRVNSIPTPVAAFVREQLLRSQHDAPAGINVLEFIDDTAQDDFADLLP